MQWQPNGNIGVYDTVSGLLLDIRFEGAWRRLRPSRKLLKLIQASAVLVEGLDIEVGG